MKGSKRNSREEGRCKEVNKVLMSLLCLLFILNLKELNLMDHKLLLVCKKKTLLLPLLIHSSFTVSGDYIV